MNNAIASYSAYSSANALLATAQTSKNIQNVESPKASLKESSKETGIYFKQSDNELLAPANDAVAFLQSAKNVSNDVFKANSSYQKTRELAIQTIAKNALSGQGTRIEV